MHISRCRQLIYQLNLLFHYPQLRIIQHDLLFTILIKLHRCNGIMGCSLHLHYFAKTEFLVLYLLPHLQTGCIAGYKISRRLMLHHFLISSFRPWVTSTNFKSFLF